MYTSNVMSEGRKVWNRWESWEDPNEDPETTFDDLMIDELGNGFGAMFIPNNPVATAELQAANDRSFQKMADDAGITRKELEKQIEAQLLAEIEMIKKENNG